MERVEILEKAKYIEWKDRRIKNAQASRGNCEIPLTIPLPRNRVLVVKGIKTEVDAEIDTYR
jgi:hypothetical protein